MPASSLVMKNRHYDRIKWFALILLPALGALYFGLGQIWHFPKVEEVVGSVTVIEVFLGTILGISNQAYKASGAAYDGSIEVEDGMDGTKLFSLNLDSDPNELDKKSQVTFKVDKSEI